MKNVSIYLIRVFISASLVLGMNNRDAHSGPKDSTSGLRPKNITRTDSLLEIKPRFIESGRSVLFLVFSGDYLRPKPWDYRLSKSDRDGQAVDYLTTNGVLDYNVLPDEQGILVLEATQSLKMSQPDYDSYDEMEGWELWYLNIKGGEKVLLESSNDLPISVGYYMLGLGILPKVSSFEYLIYSPQKTAQIVIRQEKKQDLSYFRFYYPDRTRREEVLFETEAWNSYSHTPWWPTITWLDENNFATMRFESNDDCQLLQYDGLFSIVKVDLESKSQ
ncbi:MAG: hypothetical protein ACE5NG_01935, partial [bacterium]